MQTQVSATEPKRTSPQFGRVPNDAVRDVSAVSQRGRGSRYDSPWPERDAEVITRWNAGASKAVVARAMGLTPGQVIGRIHRLQGLGLCERRGSPLRPKTEPLKRATRRKEMTAAEVAELLRLQRADRLARAAPPDAPTDPGGERTPPAPMPSEAPVPLDAHGNHEESRLFTTVTGYPAIQLSSYPGPPPAAIAAEPVIRAAAVPAASAAPARFARSNECCWPIGTPGSPAFRFCTGVAAAKTPYCEEHAKRAYENWKPREQAA